MGKTIQERLRDLPLAWVPPAITEAADYIDELEGKLKAIEDREAFEARMHTAKEKIRLRQKGLLPRHFVSSQDR